MKKFLSCDWGTSSFRLRLVDITNAKCIAAENSDWGIAKTFELWKRSGESADVRFSFYLDIIKQHLAALEKKSKTPLENVPLVISGMACSTLGMIDLPYKELPFLTNGADLVTKIVTVDHFKHNIVFISGARTERDAMRGEETQLVGCIHEKQEDQVFIFPGTHSKHISVRNEKAVDFKTFMTGEFFSLLFEKSTLTTTVEKTGLENEENKRAFEAGVKESLSSNLLHSSFIVRTNFLFQKFSRHENFNYLSGLLIGTELSEISGSNCDVTLVSNSQLQTHYQTAFTLLDPKTVLKTRNGDDAIVEGQLKILARLPS